MLGVVRHRLALRSANLHRNKRVLGISVGELYQIKVSCQVEEEDSIQVNHPLRLVRMKILEDGAVLHLYLLEQERRLLSRQLDLLRARIYSQMCGNRGETRTHTSLHSTLAHRPEKCTMHINDEPPKMSRAEMTKYFNLPNP